MDIFQWQFPEGPGTPFGSPILIALDSIRLAIVFFGFWTVVLCIPAVLMTWTITQKYRIASIGLFTIYVALTEVQRLGFHANWRLMLGMVCIIWAFVSLIAFIQYEGNPDRAGWLKRISKYKKDHDARSR